MNKFIVYGTILALFLGIILVQAQLGTSPGTGGIDTGASDAENINNPDSTYVVCTAGSPSNSESGCNEVFNSKDKVDDLGCTANQEVALTGCTKSGNRCSTPESGTTGIECNCNYKCMSPF